MAVSTTERRIVHALAMMPTLLELIVAHTISTPSRLCRRKAETSCSAERSD